MRIDNRIQALWVGARLPRMQQMSLRSFLANGHEFDLYVYEDLTEVPKGVWLRDAREILPASAVFQNASHSTYATFSDILRYRLLAERGGWWSDLDVICLRPFDLCQDYVFSSEHRILNGVVREVATITVMKAPPGSVLFQALYQESIARNAAQLAWNEIGSDLLGTLLQEYALEHAVQRATTFCPIPMNGFDSIVDPAMQFVFEPTSYAAHLWHEFWRRKKLDVDADYPADCLYEQLKARFMDAEPAALQPGFSARG